MNSLSLKIRFRPSRSKFYNQVIFLAREFDHFVMGEEENILSIDRAELFGKWEYFNLIFWKTVDWRGASLEYEGIQYQGHSDKTRIFYAVQMVHTNHICTTVDQILKLQNKYYGSVTRMDYALMFN